jgi:CheY-like chemotaxis protein
LTPRAWLLPAVLDRAATGAVPPGPDDDEHWQGSGRVLIVDDEATVRAVGAKMLEHLGFDVPRAADGHEALAVLDRHGGRFAAVLLDMMMPALGGEDTFHQIRRRYLGLPVVLSSGYNDQERSLAPGSGGRSGRQPCPRPSASPATRLYFRAPTTSLLGSPPGPGRSDQRTVT